MASSTNLKAKMELQSRLSKLFPEGIIAHQPSESMQPWLMGPQSPRGATRGVGSPPESHGPEGITSNGRSECSPAGSVSEGINLPNQQPNGFPDKAEPCKSSDPQDSLLCEVSASTVLTSAPDEEGDNPLAEPVVPKVDANPFVANAAVPGDQFQWHVDADPSEFVDSDWTQEHGRYFNRVGPFLCSPHGWCFSILMASIYANYRHQSSLSVPIRFLY